MGRDRVHRKSRDIDWGVHSLTFSTFQRQPFFRSRRTPGWYLEVLADARRLCPFNLFAYVIMPEHVHLVLQAPPGVTIQTILWRLKRPMTRRVLGWLRANTPSALRLMADRQPSGKLTYRFWQRGGGYDRHLRSSEDVHEKIGYIHHNPVRRGLVGCPEDWPWSSAAQWAKGIPGDVPIDWDDMPLLS